MTANLNKVLYPGTTNTYDTGPFSISALGIGAGYTDECTTFAVTYTSVYGDNGSGTLSRNTTVLVSLQLRTLGGTSFSKSSSTVTAANTVDGIH